MSGSNQLNAVEGLKHANYVTTCSLAACFDEPSIIDNIVGSRGREGNIWKTNFQETHILYPSLCTEYNDIPPRPKVVKIITGRNHQYIKQWQVVHYRESELEPQTTITFPVQASYARWGRQSRLLIREGLLITRL